MGVLIVGVAGAKMCELYELAGWEGGAEELSGSRSFLVPFLGDFTCIVRALDGGSLFQSWQVL